VEILPAEAAAQPGKEGEESEFIIGLQQQSDTGL